MKTHTVTVTIGLERDAVFAYLSRLENLPDWMRETFPALERLGTQWKARTPFGERHVALVADKSTGVIDLLVGDQPDEMTLWPMRVMCRPHGTAVTATLFQGVDEPDELFDYVYRLWLADLRGLPQRLGGGQIHAAPEGCGAFYPGIVTADFYGTWDFYSAHLGFRTVTECDHFVQLAHPSGAQLAVLRHELNGEVPELVSATEGRGLWLNVDVADADAEYERLRTAGLQIVSAPEDKPWGERMFIVRDPNGVLVALAHRIASRATETMALAAN